MKLLFCPDCTDVVKMLSTFRDCRCRAVSGRYVDEERVEVYGERAEVIGLSNDDVRAALDIVKLSGLRASLKAHMHLHDSPRVIRNGRDRRSK